MNLPLFVGLLFLTTVGLGQIDSLQRELQNAKSVEMKVDLMNRLSFSYSQLSLDRAEEFANDALDLAKKIGLKAKRRIEFYNATIDCRLLEYELYAGTRRIEKAPDVE